jgi:hypothetical protein
MDIVYTVQSWATMPLKDFRASIYAAYGSRSFKLYYYEDESSLILENCRNVDEQSFAEQMSQVIASFGSSASGPIFFISPGTESPEKCKGPQQAKISIDNKSRTTDTSEFSNQVQTRDGHRCCFCGAKKVDGATLHADHILEKRRAKESDIVSLLSDLHLTSIHDPSNGLTLCGQCHYLRGKGVVWTNYTTMKVEGDITMLKTKTEKEYLEQARKVIGLEIKKPGDPVFEKQFPTLVLDYRVRVPDIRKSKQAETKREETAENIKRNSHKSDKKENKFYK